LSKEELPSGLFGFTIIWIGQLLSVLGSGMTTFALTIWAWEITGEVTALSLVGFFSFGPMVLISPIAGALVDRWNRKTIMIVADSGACLMTVVILLLYSNDQLKIWHLCATGAFAGIFQSFHFLSYSAAITNMMPKKHYTRASGMQSLAGSVSRVLVPLVGGSLLIFMSIGGVLVIDVLTFLVGVSTLFFVHVPQPKSTQKEPVQKKSLWKDLWFGFDYVLKRPSLFGLQAILAADNLIASACVTMLPAMILARSGNNEMVLGSVQSAMGFGAVIGGLLLGVWGGPKRRVHGVLMGLIISNLLGSLIIGLGRSLLVWAVGAFFYFFFVPIIKGADQAIWQAKTPPDMQGRIFATRRTIVLSTTPIGMLAAGPLADRIFEPLMASGGRLEASLGWLIGTGSGAGISLMFVITGIVGILIGLVGYAFRNIREAEDILPDFGAQQ
jgi:MFS family permease